MVPGGWLPAAFDDVGPSELDEDARPVAGSADQGGVSVRQRGSGYPCPHLMSLGLVASLPLARR